MTLDIESKTLPQPEVKLAPNASAGIARVAKGLHLSLRAKGMVALAALVVYALFVSLYLMHERGRLLHIVEQLEFVNHRHQLLTKANTGLAHSVVSLQSFLNSGNTQVNVNDVILDVSQFVPDFGLLKTAYPETEQTIMHLERAIDDLVKTKAIDTLFALRDSEQKLVAQLEYFENEIERSGARLSSEYRSLNQGLTAFAILTNLFGWLVLGAGLTLFLSKLASDIRRLEGRAQAIVDGYHGPPLSVTRKDELGGLMAAINKMQSDLRTQEQRQEVLRQRGFHQEKMAAIGSIAAAVAHEVNNPINSISGIAQFTIDAARSDRGMNPETIAQNAQLILRQAERIGSIVRQIADLSAPRSSSPELLDINELVQTTCNFIRYDRRFGQIDLVLELDHQLPAVRGVADHLTQVLMNLLINAADAMDGLDSRRPSIRVSTRRTAAEIIVAVSDNGHGMDSAVLGHAFDQSFTTKPAGTGRGIGLYLCKTLIEEIGGVITLASTPGVGTVAQVHLGQRPKPAALV